MNTRYFRGRSAFTLLELLAAVAILALLMTMIFTIFNQASRSWLLGESRTETFQAARLVLDTMSRELESAIAGTNPVAYPPQSIILKDFDQSSGYSLPAPAGLVVSAPNDTLFFVANASDSASRDYCDLTEYGYIPVYCATDSYSMKAGRYYLLRHQVVSTLNNTANAHWDFLTNATWWNTPVTTASTKTPILDNVIRFIIQFEFVNASTTNLTNGTGLTDSWPPASDPSLAGKLPRAVHLRISVLDRRLAARLSAVSNGSLTTAQLTDIPYNINGSASLTEPQKSILGEGLRTFFRSVYPQNASN